MDTSTDHVGSYNIPGNMDQNSVMEDLINQWIDMHTTSLKEVEAEISSKRATTKGKVTGNLSAGSKRSRQLFTKDDWVSVASSIVSTSKNIAMIATN
ncbi:hypothetical protein LINPERPRIM_LOCUS6096 [Linum perenne]